VPRPEFPFDPGGYAAGGRAAIAGALILAALLASAYLLRRLRVSVATAPAGALAPLGVLCVLAGAILWLANPYLALLAAPGAHVWLLADRLNGRIGGAVLAVIALLAAVPVGAALLALADALDLGGDAPWTLTLMIADGQIGFLTVIAACFMAGGIAASVALAAGGGGRLPATPGDRPPASR
jgi:hypothetical protein